MSDYRARGFTEATVLVMVCEHIIGSVDSLLLPGLCSIMEGNTELTETSARVLAVRGTKKNKDGSK